MDEGQDLEALDAIYLEIGTGSTIGEERTEDLTGGKTSGAKQVGMHEVCFLIHSSHLYHLQLAFNVR